MGEYFSGNVTYTGQHLVLAADDLQYSTFGYWGISSTWMTDDGQLYDQGMDYRIKPIWEGASGRQAAAPSGGGPFTGSVAAVAIGEYGSTDGYGRPAYVRPIFGTATLNIASASSASLALSFDYYNIAFNNMTMSSPAGNGQVQFNGMPVITNKPAAGGYAIEQSTASGRVAGNFYGSGTPSEAVGEFEVKSNKGEVMGTWGVKR
jgi:hypothetical protein